jgi:phosphate transport system permease protein
VKNFWKSGDPFVWLTGGSLVFCLLMIAGLVGLILVKGLVQFWPQDVREITLDDGRKYLGEVWNREEIPGQDGTGSGTQRIRLKTGNRDIYAADFVWLNESDITNSAEPGNAIVLERTEWGNFYGYFDALKIDGEAVETDLAEAWPSILQLHGRMEDLRSEIDDIEKDEIAGINFRMEKLRLEIRRFELGSGTTDAQETHALQEIKRRVEALQAQYLEKESVLAELAREAERYVLSMVTADGRGKDVGIADIVRIYRPNGMGFMGKVGLYAEKAWEFISGSPRESNTEGGIFPAIFGTVMMVMLMSVAVVPLGVLAAIYLREYATQGPWVRTIRIAVNNLAGVPSIVYGIFGLGFFVYTMGGGIDRLFFPEALPTPTYGTGGILWASLTLALLTVPVVIVATEEGLAAVPREVREGSLALSATKFETLWRVVVPGAMPGILTGTILAIARAAGEVAPLMITGVVKLAPSLPLDDRFPFLHLERKFMHLGFHIYDVGFQSPNVEAAIPMVYSTTLLLLVIVILLNIVAIIIRNRLRRRLSFSVF